MSEAAKNPLLKSQFQVIRDGVVVFRRDFPATTGGQVSELPAVALHDLHNKRPDIILLDKDFIMKWIALEA